MARQILLLLALGLSACANEEKFYYPDHKFDRTPLGDSIDIASMRFLKETYAATKDKNIVASPVGVFTLLSLYAGGAGPETKEQIVRVLGAANYSRLSESYDKLDSILSSVDTNFFTMANKIYLGEQFTLKPPFGDLLRARGDVEQIDFTDPEAATATINQWGEEKTKGHIKNPVPDDAISSDSAIALINIMFFQGQWNVPFESNGTENEDFHLDKTTTVQKPTMHLKKPLFMHQSEDLGAKLIELPYKQKGFRMIVVLPDELDGLASVIDKLESKGMLADVFNIYPSRADIDFYMPKFEIKSEHNLKDLLPKMGVDKLFSEESNSFVNEEGIAVSSAFQSAYVKVDEEGATAGAFTGVVMVFISDPPIIPPPITVRVDHPFLYAICYEDIILSVGTVTH